MVRTVAAITMTRITNYWYINHPSPRVFSSQENQIEQPVAAANGDNMEKTMDDNDDSILQTLHCSRQATVQPSPTKS